MEGERLQTHLQRVSHVFRPLQSGFAEMSDSGATQCFPGQKTSLWVEKPVVRSKTQFLGQKS